MNSTDYILPLIVLAIVGYALVKRVCAYDAFMEGIKDGIHLFGDVFPALLGMMFAISMLRESGLMQILCDSITNYIKGIP
ncbi:MAG: spore maturation protein, partial [Longicatena sp.]